MSTQKPPKSIPRKSKDEFYDYDEFPKKSKEKKPKRGKKDPYFDDEGNDRYDDDY